MNLNFDRRKLVVSIVIIVILLFVLAVGGWLLRRQRNAVLNEPAVSPPINTLPAVKPEPLPVKTLEEERLETVSRLARLFAERFGTFSNQSHYEGISDIMAVSTEDFQSWLKEKYLPEIKEKDAASAYIGETTKVMNVTVDKISSDGAQATAQVQRTVTDETGIIEVQYPELIIALVRENDVWLVDSAYWGGR